MEPSRAEAWASVLDHGLERLPRPREGIARLARACTLGAKEVPVSHVLSCMEEEDQRFAELRLFGGCSHLEVAKLLGMSERSAKRRWRYIKAFIRDKIHYS